MIASDIDTVLNTALIRTNAMDRQILGDIPDEMYDQIYQDYLDEREGQLDYWAEEITEREYLVGIGEIDDDDYEEDEGDED